MNRRELYATGYYKDLAPEPRFREIVRITRKLNRTFYRLLDIGCGDGTFTVMLGEAAKAQELFGMDIAAEAVASARTRGIQAIQLDVDEDRFPYDDTHFDIVYSGEVIEHLFNPDRLLREIHRVLKPDGVGLISTPNLAGWPSRLALLLGYQPFPMAVSPEHESAGKLIARGNEGQWGHIRVFTTRAFRELLDIHGFRVRHLIGCRVSVTSPLPSSLRTLLVAADRLASKVPSLASRVIAVIEKS
ncbi:MAG: class I SAM-dependent methyltransferase [Dehalococcoidia bacterium]